MIQIRTCLIQVQTCLMDLLIVRSFCTPRFPAWSLCDSGLCLCQEATFQICSDLGRMAPPCLTLKAEGSRRCIARCTLLQSTQLGSSTVPPMNMEPDVRFLGPVPLKGNGSKPEEMGPNQDRFPRRRRVPAVKKVGLSA